METDIKIGMVGLDTSHCPAFTGIFNDPNNEHHIPGARVVGAYPGGSERFSLSRDRVNGFTRQLRDDFGVTLYDSIPALVKNVDAILLESADGRQHLEQFRELAVGKPVYLDKPLATTTAEARQIIQLARDTETPLMSCSSLRYAKGITDLVEPDAQVISCEAFGPAVLLEDYPGLFWYGIHSAEMLFSKMGPGCRSVRCIEHPLTDIVVGEWEEGRIGVMRGTRFEGGAFGCVVHTSTGAACGIAASTPPYYALMLQEVKAFFETGVSPIDIRETWDIIAFLEAAEYSRANQGRVITTPTL
jgi:hypothetical protein